MSDPLSIPTFADVQTAARRIAGVVRRTPTLRFEYLSDQIGADVFLKCENLQHMGAFKYRGATNAVLSLDDVAAKRGVVTHSSGNHGAALALAAKRRDIPAYIVVPDNCSPMKLANIREFGADVRLCAPTVAARGATAAAVMAETGATMVHPYDDPLVIAGQGTAALELLEDVAGIDSLAVCISGGGLMSGLSIAAHGINPAIEMTGVEPEVAADAKESIETGILQPSSKTSGSTIADGLRASLSARTLMILRQHVREVVTVSEAEIITMMRLTWERAKLVIEPSSAVPLAAVLKYRERFAGKRVGVVVTGGNVSLDRLPWQS